MAEGYIYILFNRAFQNDHYKIGMTTKTPGQRAQEISNATGVPRPFEVLYEQRVSNCREAERLLHERLRQHRSATISAAAAACHPFLRAFAHMAVDAEAVIVVQFLALMDRA